MNAAHTPGLLLVGETAADDEGNPETVIRGMGGRAGVAVAIDFGKNNPEMRMANAERLVACWNACDGLSMDAFDGGWTAKGLSKYAKSLELRLTEAAALLRDVVRPHDEQARQAEKAGEAPKLNPLAGRIHEFLEAAGPLIAFARPLVRPPAPVADALPDTERGSCD